MPGLSAAQHAPPAAALQSYKAGLAAAGAGNFEEAEQDFGAAVAAAPGFEPAYSALAVALLRQGRTGEGIQNLERANSLVPSDRLVLQNLAIAYASAGEHQKSIRIFRQLFASPSGRSSEQLLRSYVAELVAVRDFAEAESILKRRVLAAPRNAELQDELGSVYAMDLNWPDAIVAFRRALASRPDFALAHMHLALALAQAGEPGAEKEIDLAHQLSPDNQEISRQYAAFTTKSDDSKLSVEALEANYRAHPNTANAYQLGLALQSAGQVQRALPLLENVATAMPKNSEALTNYGMALCQLQRAKDAVPILQQAVKLSPHSATAHQDLAVAYVQLSQFSDAAEQLKLAIQLSPDAYALHYNLGLVYKMEDDAADAIPQLETAAGENPEASEPGYVLGILYLQAGRYTEAEHNLSESLRLQPQNGEAWETMGNVESNLNKLPEAEEALRKAIALLPEESDAHLTLAAVMTKEGKSAEAIAERRQAAELMRDHMNKQRAEVAINTGTNLLKEGKVTDAQSSFTEAVKFDPSNAAAHEGLAQALERQGRATEAAAERQKEQVANTHQ